MKRFILAAFAAATLALASGRVLAQVNTSATPVNLWSQYQMVSIAATAAASAQATLTIPAPAPSFYNYVCTLHFNASHDNTATTALTNGVTTSTNFNSFAIKFSLNNVANQNYDWVEGWGVANVGCAKSAAPGTATTFVSPTGTANMQFTWSATYYQAP
jgi:hypothetical protein